MIKISSVILSCRTKLGDTDIKKQRYSDMEIIDAINDTVSVMSEDLLCFSKTWVIDCKECVARYELPHDFLKPIHLHLNNKLITNIKSIESEKKGSGASFDLQTVHFFGTNIKDNDRIEIYYNYIETISNKEESIHLPLNAKEIIVSYALHLLYQNPIRKDGTGRSTHYYNLYEKKIIALRNRVKMNSQSVNITTKFKKV
ncbi:MAG: Unknown protein [uncultured Sulfurovum sp.]|uniref:Uncharacterized protein n=1 Tax=uncultured Sulfurovum sp. TaxID=269237 RepID=A0A6S6SPP8_9BACT|nr:MAG: Unknown protein [uncultured Sulfurovum sp.]